MDIHEGRKQGFISILLLLAGISALCGILFMSYRAVQGLSDSYFDLKKQENTEYINGSISYDDHLYAVIGYGTSIGSESVNRKETLNDFFADAMPQIDRRIYHVGILYTMMITACFSLFICDRNTNKPLKQLKAIILSVIGVYLLYLAVIIVFHMVFKVPVYPPRGSVWLTLAVSVLSVIGGHCSVSVLLRKLKKRWIAAVLIIPAVFGLFIVGTALEGRLFAPQYVESFSYLSDKIAECQEGESYYDETKNVVVIKGEEYEPRQEQNSEYIGGIGRIAVTAFETINPYSGNAIDMVAQISNGIPEVATILYSVKAVIWIILAAVIPAGKD